MTLPIATGSGNLNKMQHQQHRPLAPRIWSAIPQPHSINSAPCEHDQILCQSDPVTVQHRSM
jgi:hypothetical protein